MNALDLVNALGGRWDKGRGYGFVCCPCHIDRTPSLKVIDGPDGDVILHCFAGCSWRDVKDELRGQGLLPPLNGKREQKPRPQQKHTTQTAAPDQNANIEIARKIWRDAVPASGTLVELYLRSRSITMPIPPTIRFSSKLKHGPTGVRLPAMVAAVQGPDGRVTGVSRTFLRIDGKAKAPFSSPKMMLGRCVGGSVRFAPAGPILAIGEGIETSLTVMQETNIPTWAALSTAGMAGVILPPCVREVVLCPDGDEPGATAAKVAAERFLSEGRRVRIATPPEGKDFNDLVPQAVCHG